MNGLRICFMGDSYMNGTSDPKMLGWVRRLCHRAIELNQAYIELAEELSVPYLDILSPLRANDSYMAGLTQSDRMHCDEHGYALMESTVDAWSS